MSTSDLHAILELVASERPASLSWLLDVLRSSPAGSALGQLAEDWLSQLGDLDAQVGAALARVAVKAARDLGRLDRRRSWSTPDVVVPSPNVAALYCFANARAGRMAGLAQRRHLEVIARKLERAYELHRTKHELEEFMSRKSSVDLEPGWLRDFMGWGDG